MSEDDVEGNATNSNKTPSRRSENRMFPNIENIRQCFTESPLSDIQVTHIKKDHVKMCDFYKRDSEGKLSSIIVFDSLLKVLESINVTNDTINIDAISSILSHSIETIYDLSRNDIALISKELPSGEIIFLVSSFDKREEAKLGAEESNLVSQIKIDFRFLDECFEYQKLLREKDERQQDPNNAAE